MDLKIQIAQEADCEALVDLVNSAYRGDSSRKGWTTEADLLGGQRTDPQTLLSTLREPDAVVLTASQEDQLIGCVYLKKKGDSAYLGMLTIRPTLQAGGLGKRLLAEAENWAVRTWGTARMEMTVIQQRKELLAWYERRGYRITDRTEPFPYGDEKFGLPKVKDLLFLVLEKSL